MTLQERILEVVGTRTLTPRELYAQLSGENAGVVDCAVAGLMRGGLLQKAFGAYTRPNAGSGSKPPQPAPPAPSSPQPAEPASKPAETRRCRRCHIPKALGQFAGPQARICIPCTRPTGRPPKQPIVVSARVIASLEKRRADLAAEIDRAVADIAAGREELADLTQFLDWVATQTGKAR